MTGKDFFLNFSKTRIIDNNSIIRGIHYKTLTKVMHVKCLSTGSSKADCIISMCYFRYKLTT